MQWLIHKLYITHAATVAAQPDEPTIATLINHCAYAGMVGAGLSGVAMAKLEASPKTNAAINQLVQETVDGILAQTERQMSEQTEH